MSETRLAVSSELYDEYLLKKSPLNSELCSKITVKFIDATFLKTSSLIEVDEDGDLILDRSKNELILEVSLSTQISGVGLQLWRGALLLSDFLIYTKDQLIDKSILELGSGVGLTSIVASMFAKKVISTDIDRDGILDRIENNFKINSKFVKSCKAIKALDFCSLDWDDSLEQDVLQTDIIIAADVIYDNDLTDAFIKTLTKILLSSKKAAFIALEKRYVFTLDDLDSVAPCYEYFIHKLESSWNAPPMSNWIIKSISLDFPQYLSYERNKHLVLWQINS